MSDLQLSATDGKAKPASAALATPELDERVWLAWKEKHRAKDKVRAARRRRVLMILLPIAALVLVAAYLGGAFA